MNIHWMKSGIYFLLAMMLLSSVFAAQSFTASTQVVDNRIFSDEVAEFTFNLQNFDVEEDRFTIFTTDPQWNIYFENSLVSVPDKGLKDFSVIVDPTSSVAQGQIYSIPLIIKSLNDNEQLEVFVSVTVDSNEIRTYKPSIFTDVVVGDANIVDPLETVPFKIRFINKNALDIIKLDVRITSNLINDEFSIPLGPQEESTKLLSYQISPQTIPGEKFVDISLSIDGEEVGVEKRFVYEVAQSRPAIQRKVVDDSSEFLASSYEVTLTNNGNIAQSETFYYALSWWAELFTDATQYDAVEKIDGSRQLVYNVGLEPGDSTTISVETSYKLFTLIVISLLVLIFGSIFSYYYFRAPVVIKKRVTVLGEAEDGVSRLKVILDIKNRTGKLLKNIRVMERAPTITDVDEDFTLGTLAPSKVIKNAVKGTLIRWDFNTIDPYEERLITYTIKSKLSILGELKLPETIVKYERFGHMQTVKESVSEDEDDE